MLPMFPLVSFTPDMGAQILEEEMIAFYAYFKFHWSPSWRMADGK